MVPIVTFVKGDIIRDVCHIILHLQTRVAGFNQTHFPGAFNKKETFTAILCFTTALQPY